MVGHRSVSWLYVLILWWQVSARPLGITVKTITWHDDVIKWNHFPRYWPFVRGIHRSPVNSPHKGQWRRALIFYLICVRINGWVNNGEAGDLRRYRARYDVIVMRQVSARPLGITVKTITWSVCEGPRQRTTYNDCHIVDYCVIPRTSLKQPLFALVLYFNHLMLLSGYFLLVHFSRAISSITPITL